MCVWPPTLRRKRSHTLPTLLPNQNVSHQSQPSETDVLIVGGGPAGLAAAITLRQRGIECTVVEARPPAVDKACGEGLMPDSRDVLVQLGIALTPADGHPFRGIRFVNATHSAEARFPDGEGVGIRRPQLHALLTARAETLGAKLLWESHVKLPRSHHSSSSASRSANRDAQIAIVNGRELRYRWLIGADGQASTVRRWAGLNRARKQSQRYGFRTHYRVSTSDFDMVEIHWGRGGQLYLTPVAPDCVCAVYLSRDPHRGKEDMLSEFPAIARRLAGPAGIEPLTQRRGAVSATCRLRRVASDHIALIGDASGSADSITGEGLAVSFRQALALAEAIAHGSLASYERAHRRIARLPHTMGALMLTLDRWPRFQTHAMRGLSVTPAFFQQLLDAHVGVRSLASVLLRCGPRFAWNLFRDGTSQQPCLGYVADVRSP